jgi:hypothetical protein
MGYTSASTTNTFIHLSSARLVHPCGSHNTADRWQFPLLIQFSPKFPVVKPFVEAGPSFSHIANGHHVAVVSTEDIFRSSTSNSQTNDLRELRHSTVAGVTAGIGVDLHPRFLHVRPEFRYTRWASPQFSALSEFVLSDILYPMNRVPSISSKRDQIDFLLGITF